MSSFTSVHRLFIQTCSSRSCMTKKEALSAFQPLWLTDTAHKKAATMDDMTDCIMTINTELAPYSQKISVDKFYLTNEEYVVFTHTAGPAPLKFQKTFTELDLNFFRVLLKELVMSDGFSIELIAAINATNQMPASTEIAKNRAEKLIETWSGQGYLYSVEDVLHFGPRCITEFGEYMRKLFPDNIPECMLCKGSIFKSMKCADCSEPFHRECLLNYMKKKSNCPKCKKPWKVRMSL